MESEESACEAIQCGQCSMSTIGLSIFVCVLWYGKSVIPLKIQMFKFYHSLHNSYFSSVYIQKKHLDDWETPGTETWYSERQNLPGHTQWYRKLIVHNVDVLIILVTPRAQSTSVGPQKCYVLTS